MKLRIRDWNKNFETAESRKLKSMKWVAIPNKTDGEGYTALVDHPNAAAHLGAWYAIVETASRQDPRGELPRGISQNIRGISQSLGRISRLPSGIFEEVLPRLMEIGWLECYEQDMDIPGESARVPGESARVPGIHIQDITLQDKTTTATTATTVRLMPVELRPQTEYPETLRTIQEHDRSVDGFFCQRLADTAAQQIISDPVAGNWTMEKQRMAVSDKLLAMACREVYLTPRKKPPGTGLLLSLVPRILIGGKTNYA